MDAIAALVLAFLALGVVFHLVCLFNPDAFKQTPEEMDRQIAERRKREGW